jgi:hypothetical protein
MRFFFFRRKKIVNFCPWEQSAVVTAACSYRRWLTGDIQTVSCTVNNSQSFLRKELFTFEKLKKK